MASISTNEFRSGLKLLIDNDPYNIVENEFVKPGKGQAFNRVKLRNLKNGRILERTYKSGESVDLADIMEVTMQYLYSDGEFWHFMDSSSFEQYAADVNAVEEAKQWIKGEEDCLVMLWNNQPLQITAPNFVQLDISETEPGIRGDTSGGGSKSAVLETGARVRVPLFLNEGDKIRIDTRTGEYVSRAKD
jgi:elongation factor P